MDTVTYPERITIVSHSIVSFARSLVRCDTVRLGSKRGAHDSTYSHACRARWGTVVVVVVVVDDAPLEDARGFVLCATRSRKPRQPGFGWISSLWLKRTTTTTPKNFWRRRWHESAARTTPVGSVSRGISAVLVCVYVCCIDRDVRSSYPGWSLPCLLRCLVLIAENARENAGDSYLERANAGGDRYLERESVLE